MEESGVPYALPLDDLLLVLRTSGHTYYVRAALPASLFPFPARRGERVVAEVLVTAGQVRCCQIRDQRGVSRIEGAQALAWVRSREEVIWVVTQATLPEASLPAMSAASAAPLASRYGSPPLALPWAARPPPIRRRDDPGMMAHLSPRQRRVWLLVDGRRTVHQLAPLLGMSLEVLDQELTELERRGLITAGSFPQARG